MAKPTPIFDKNHKFAGSIGQGKDKVPTASKKLPKGTNAEVQVSAKPPRKPKPFFKDSIESSNGKYRITLERKTLNAPYFLTFVDKETRVEHVIPEDILEATLPELESKYLTAGIRPWEYGLRDAKDLLFQFQFVHGNGAMSTVFPSSISRDGKYKITLNEDENSVLIISYRNRETNQTYTFPETLVEGGGKTLSWGGRSMGGPLPECWILFSKLRDLTTEKKSKAIKITSLNPKLIRENNGELPPIYYVKNKAYSHDEGPEDEVLLRWHEPGLHFDVNEKTPAVPGWGLYFRGSWGYFIDFAPEDDLEAIKVLALKMNDQESIKIAAALSDPEASNKLMEKEAEKQANHASWLEHQKTLKQ